MRAMQPVGYLFADYEPALSLCFFGQLLALRLQTAVAQRRLVRTYTHFAHYTVSSFPYVFLKTRYAISELDAPSAAASIRPVRSE
jgi:hypothetical protein